MGSTFKSKAQQFVSDVVSEVKLNGKSGPILKQKEQKEPEVYREESRVAEHGMNVIFILKSVIGFIKTSVNIYIFEQ